MTRIPYKLQLKQLDRKLRSFREMPVESKSPPRKGWISAIRRALGMSGTILAARMQVSQSAETQFEKGEQDKSISLATLQKIAEALDAELVYAIVPRKPIEEILKERAVETAWQRIQPLAHSMNLENQGTSDERLKHEVEELAQELMKRPKELWR